MSASMRGVQELVGHQNLAMTQRYAHLSPASLDATIRLPEQRPIQRAVGDSLETPKGKKAYVEKLERDKWLAFVGTYRTFCVMPEAAFGDALKRMPEVVRVG